MDSSGGNTQWIIDVLVPFALATAGAFGILFKQLSGMEQDVDKKIDATRKDASLADDKIWDAHHRHVTATSDFRERISEQLGAVAKKSDIDKLRDDMLAREDRILQSIQSISPNHTPNRTNNR